VLPIDNRAGWQLELPHEALRAVGLACRLLQHTLAMQTIHVSRARTRSDDLRRYFEYSQAGVDVVEDGLKEMSFGEYLVEAQVLDRFQLFRALQMQDRLPGVRLGEAAAALGYAPIGAIEKIHERFRGLQTVDIAA
jgi:hypothetical protein